MAEGAPSPGPPAALRPAARRPGHGGAPALTWLGALTVFAVVLLVLAWRMLGGHDPALGAAQPRPAVAAPTEVIVRRIVKRRIVITTELPAAGAAVSTAGGGGSAPAPVSAARAPAPAAAPAPAPTPAPTPVTRSS